MINEVKTLKYNGKIIFEKVAMSTNFKRIPKLFSENEACFLFLTKGTFQFRTPTNVITYSKNEAMLAKCGNYFIESMSEDNEVKEETIVAIGAFFYPDIVKRFFETDLSIQQFRENYDVKKINIEPLMKSFIESIDFLIDHPDVADENIILNKLRELLLILSKSENAASITQFVSSLFVPFEYDFKEIIQKNIYSDLSVDELAKLCNCSVATFKRKFLEMYNESPAKYFSIKKLEKASQLLLIESKPIAEIAYECGFETVSNFNRAFKLHFHQTPSQFRMS